MRHASVGTRFVNWDVRRLSTFAGPRTLAGCEHIKRVFVAAVNREQDLIQHG
jgi:hypothetical protein